MIKHQCGLEKFVVQSFVFANDLHRYDSRPNLKAKDLTAKDQGLTLKAKAKDSKFVLEVSSRPRTKDKDNNTDSSSDSLPLRSVVGLSSRVSSVWLANAKVLLTYLKSTHHK